jgi:hypothetical protein
MFKEFLTKIFSAKCRLISLELDISNDDSSVDIHRCFLFPSDTYSNIINSGLVTHCMNLRYLHIHLIYGYILEHIIQRVPALEVLSVQFTEKLIKDSVGFKVKRFAPTLVNWYDKVT